MCPKTSLVRFFALSWKFQAAVHDVYRTSAVACVTLDHDYRMIAGESLFCDLTFKKN
jgi:hypothetical protein